jgi:hypothetical protein
MPWNLMEDDWQIGAYYVNNIPAVFDYTLYSTDSPTGLKVKLRNETVLIEPFWPTHHGTGHHLLELPIEA